MEKRYLRKTNTIIGVLSIVSKMLASNGVWSTVISSRIEGPDDNTSSPEPALYNVSAIQTVRSRLAGKEEFSFVVIGDTRGYYPTFRKVMARAVQHSPDFIIHTGDLTKEGTKKSYARTLFEMNEFGVPAIFCIGNHDASGSGLKHFSRILGTPNFFFDIHGYRFIFLNNTCKTSAADISEVSDNPMAADCAAGLENLVLKEIERLIQGKEHNIIVMHIPPPLEPFAFHSFEKNGQQFLNLMAEYAERITAVFSGHVHGYASIQWQGVRYVVSGGGGSPLHTREGIIDRFNYVIIKISNGTLTEQVHFVD